MRAEGWRPIDVYSRCTKIDDSQDDLFCLQRRLQKVPPQVNEINKIDQGLQGVRIEALLSGQSGVSLAYRYQKLERFVQVEMKDDGTNGDQKAGDLIYTATVPYKDGGAQYYIYAENNDAGIFTPEG